MRVNTWVSPQGKIFDGISMADVKSYMRMYGGHGYSISSGKDEVPRFTKITLDSAKAK